MDSPHREAAIEAAAEALHIGDLAYDRLLASKALDAARPHERAAFLEELCSEEALKAFDRVFITTVWAEDDMPALPDYERGMRAAFKASLESEERS
jgi:hypothetical protein